MASTFGLSSQEKATAEPGTLEKSEETHKDLAVPAWLPRLHGQRNVGTIVRSCVFMTHGDADALLFPVQLSVGKTRDHQYGVISGRGSPAIGCGSMTICYHFQP